MRRVVNPSPLRKQTLRVNTPVKPKIRSLYKKYPTKRFGGTTHSFISHHTTKNGNITRITFDLELGDPFATEIHKKISGAGSKKFSTVSWSNLSLEALPEGVTYTTLGKPGEPEIPALTIRIAIPEGVSGIMSFTDHVISSSLFKTFLLPRVDSKNDRGYIEKKYAAPFTADPILSQPAKIRTVNIISLTVPLIEFNGRTGSIKAKKKFSCGITFNVPTQFTVASSKKTSDPIFEQLNSKLAANTSDMRTFRSGFHTNPVNQKTHPLNIPATFDKSVTNWIDPASPYIKLYATRTGLYRVTPQMITPKFDITGWHPSEMRMFNKGKEVPIWIDTSSNGTINAIEYFGERLAGYPGEYLNWDSDSNAYWLTNSKKFQNAPLRFTDKVINGNPSLTVTDGNSTLHHEQDNFYYGGDDTNQTATLQNADWVPGERFIWQPLPYSHNNNDVLQVSDSFMISSLPSTVTGKQASVVVFLRGMSSLSGSSVIHNASIVINGNSTQVSFTDYNELRDTFQIPLSQLKVGVNTFQIQYKQGSQTPDKWYLDYYEILLNSPLAASSDTAIANGQWDFRLIQSQSPFTISLTPAGAPPHLYNLTDGSRLIPNGSTASYNENRIDMNRYVAATLQTFLSPDRIDTVITRFASALDTTNGADYIIITHPLFLNAAQRLAARRQISGLRAKVITTDEVFNAFNFGSDEPWAIRRYLQYAFDFYNGTPPALVTLFGEGTWDPKFNLNNPLQDESARTIHRSFVPTFGVPNSDYIFTTVEGTSGVDSQTFRMVISRIPVETSEEADDFIQKIFEYETSVPAPWNKNFTFISGGDPGTQWADLLEDNKLYVGLSPYSTNQFGGLGNPHISVDTTFIWRHDFSAIDITQIPAIQTAFKNGQSLVYFFGHGAPNITDVQFPDVGTLHNTGIYPVFMTVSCRTGAFAEPNIISMNQSFILAPEAGAILAYGTTGFGEVNYDFNMSAQIFNFLRGDSAFARMPAAGPHKINFPMIMTASKFIQSVLASPSPAFVDHNSLYEYSILGDAATGFDLRPQPELNITPPDILLFTGKDSIPRTVFSLNDSEILVRYTVHNFGYGIDKPAHIRITDNESGTRQIVFIDTIESLEKIATSGVIISLDSFAVGPNTLDILVDFDNQFPESNKLDNEAQVTFLVNGNSATPFYPPEGSKYFCDITPDSVHVILLLPHTASGATMIDVQFDTTSAFNSTLLKDFSGFQATGLFFQKSFARSTLPTSVSNVIWWRARSTLSSGNQSTFQAQSFSLNAPKPTSARSEFSYSTGDQFMNTIISGLQVDKNDGALFIPLRDTVIYDIEARGQHDSNVVGSQTPVGLVLINGRTVYETPYIQGQFTSVALLELTPDGSGIAQAFEFLHPDNDSVATVFADSLTAIIQSIPTGRQVIVLTNFQPFYPIFTHSDTVLHALQTLGSLHGMNDLYYFGSYALFGQKGLAPGLAREKTSGDHSMGASVFDTLYTLGTFGMAQTPQTAIATGYGNLRWIAQNVNQNSTIKFTVLGIRKKDGTIDTVAKVDASTGSSFDLSTLPTPASFWDRLFVQMNFQRSSSSTVSPRLNLIELEYDPAPEFYIADSSLMVFRKDTVEGYPVTATYQVQNMTCVDADNVPVQLMQTYHGNSVILATDTIKHFAGHSTVPFTHQIATTGFTGTVNLTSTVNPGKVLNEQLTFNNSSSTVYTINRDSLKPRLDLVFDSRHINNGDYVASKVTIEIRLSANNPIRISDSTSMKGVLQPLFGNKGPTTFSGAVKSDSFAVVFKTLASGALQATLDIAPLNPLPSGRYLFTAFGNDATGNRTDTISDEFIISGTNGFDRVMNYPNPFKDNTWFTFLLKSASQADVKVVVYTVAGRKIRTLHLDPAKQHVGLNTIEWDGRDEMGNVVANGTYLYRIVLNGTNDDGTPSSDAVTERAVRSR